MSLLYINSCSFTNLLLSIKTTWMNNWLVTWFTCQSHSRFNSLVTPFASYLYALFRPTTWFQNKHIWSNMRNLNINIKRKKKMEEKNKLSHLFTQREISLQCSQEGTSSDQIPCIDQETRTCWFYLESINQTIRVQRV